MRSGYTVKTKTLSKPQLKSTLEKSSRQALEVDDHKEEDFRSYGIRLGEYCSKLLPCLTGEWLERLMPVPGVIIANPAVSGVISGKLILTAGLIQSILWRELALCFDFDSHCISQWAKFQLSFHHMCNSTPADKSEAKLVHCSLSRPRMAHSNTCFLHSLKTGPQQTPDPTRVLTRQLQTDSFIH